MTDDWDGDHDIAARMNEAADEIAQLRHERDDARKEIELLQSELKLARVPAVPVEALKTMADAADEIERLRALIAELREESTGDLAEIDRLRDVVMRCQDEIARLKIL